MKVLNVVDGPGWTGGVEQTLLLSRELRKRGVDARLAAHHANPVIGEAAEAGVPVYALAERGRWGNLRQLLKILPEGFDVVVGHKPGAVRRLIVPLALFYRHSVFIGVRRVSFPVSPLTVYRFPRLVVAVADKVKEVLVRSGLGTDKVVVIPSGVDVELFRPSPERGRETRAGMGLGEGPVLLNLAKFVPAQKGQRVLFEAVRRLKERFPLKLLLAGLETDGEGARDLVREYGLEQVVILLGFRRDIPELLNAADLFVFPSLPGLDAIAGSLLQAMACRKVVIASDVGGIPEYLVDGENGFLVPPGDAGLLEGAITRALELAGPEARELGRRARRTVCERYSTGTMADSYLELFRKLLPGEGGEG